MRATLDEAHPTDSLESSVISMLQREHQIPSSSAQWLWDTYVYAFRTCEWLESIGITEPAHFAGRDVGVNPEEEEGLEYL